MFKKLVPILLSLCLLGTTNVFAAEPATPEESMTTITPFDSALIVNLTTTAFNSIYADNFPLLLPSTVTITSNPYNIGNAEIRLTRQNGAILDSAIVAPGRSVTFSLPTATDGSLYFVQARAVANNGAYAFIVDKGNEGNNIRVFQANPNTFTNVSTENAPTLFSQRLTITNNSSSPGTLIIQVQYQDSGEQIGSPQTVPPGQSAVYTIPPQLSGRTYVILAKSITAGNAPYFISLEKQTIY